jgi:hypothetical protein
MQTSCSEPRLVSVRAPNAFPALSETSAA